MYLHCVGWDSSDGIAACYRLDGLRIESRWGARFFASIQTDLGAHPASHTMGTGFFLGVKWPGCGIDHPTPSSTDIKERKELRFYSLSGPL